MAVRPVLQAAPEVAATANRNLREAAPELAATAVRLRLEAAAEQCKGCELPALELGLLSRNRMARGSVRMGAMGHSPCPTSSRPGPSTRRRVSSARPRNPGPKGRPPAASRPRVSRARDRNPVPKANPAAATRRWVSPARTRVQAPQASPAAAIRRRVSHAWVRSRVRRRPSSGKRSQRSTANPPELSQDQAAYRRPVHRSCFPAAHRADRGRPAQE